MSAHTFGKRNCTHTHTETGLPRATTSNLRASWCGVFWAFVESRKDKAPGPQEVFVPFGMEIYQEEVAR